MKSLILDTSTNFLIVSFIDDNKIIYEVKEEGKNNHSDNLLRFIEIGLKKHKLEVKNFDRIIVGIGPGAYTGLRVSLTVAKMFSWCLGIPLFTISSLELLISGYLDSDGIYAVKFRAKKDYCYSMVVVIKNKEIQYLEKESFVSLEEFNKSLLKYSNPIIIDEQFINYNALNISEDNLVKVTEIHCLEPNYLRSDI